MAPAASAAAFLAAPASSTPMGSLDSSQTTPARLNTCASVAARRSSVEAATSPAPAVTISWAWAGPPTQATRRAPKRARSMTVGAAPSGGTRPLASETKAARWGAPACSRPSMTSSSPTDGTPRNT